MPDSGSRTPPPLAGGQLHGGAKLVLGKYELLHLIGTGASAKVFLARNLLTGQSMAIKRFCKLHVSNDRFANHIKREISILRHLRHPNVLRLHEVLASRSKIYFVLDLLNGGDLFTRVSATGHLPEDLCRRYFRQLITALEYCHSRGVFHRDLKLENLLLDENDNIKVSDFGLSTTSDYARQDGLFHTLCGTPAYVAPEIIARKGYNAAAVDVWSCGIILFILVAGYLPFNDHNLITMYRKIYRGVYQCPSWTSQELRHLISRLLERNSETRITIEEILAHPWLMPRIDERKLEMVMAGRELCKFSKADEVDSERRELNAFDIIGFSSGADLSGLFGALPEKERFVSGDSPEAVLRRVETAGRSEGLEVGMKGKNGKSGVVLLGQSGNLVVGLEVYRLSEELILLEVERGRFADGLERWAGEFWREIPAVFVGPVNC